MYYERQCPIGIPLRSAGIQISSKNSFVYSAYAYDSGLITVTPAPDDTNESVKPVTVVRDDYSSIGITLHFSTNCVYISYNYVSPNDALKAFFNGANLHYDGEVTYRGSCYVDHKSISGKKFVQWVDLRFGYYYNIDQLHYLGGTNSEYPVPIYRDLTTITVNFDAHNGGQNPQPRSYDETIGETSIELPLPVFPGRTFLGWFDAEEGGTKVGDAGDSYSYDNDTSVTLHAHWSDEIRYNVGFDGNGATSGSTAAISDKGYSEEFQLSLNGFIRQYRTNFAFDGGGTDGYVDFGYSFSGWARTADGEAEFLDGEIVSGLTEDDGATVVLYAKWGGSGIVLPSAHKDGYTFLGWFDAEEGGAKVGDAGDYHLPTSNATLYARYEQKTNFVLRVVKSGDALARGTVFVTDANGNRWDESDGVVELTAEFGAAYYLNASYPSGGTVRFGGWSSQDIPLSNPLENPKVIVRQSGDDIEITATFADAVHNLTVLTNDARMGYVEAYVNGVKQESLSGITANEGQTVRVVAHPSVIRYLDRWNIGEESVSQQEDYTFVVSQDMEKNVLVSAVFVTKPAQLFNVAKVNGQLGTISLSYNDIIDHETGEVIPRTYDVPLSGGEVVDGDFYSGVGYSAVAAVNEHLSEAGRQLDYFDGWYVKRDGVWVRQTTRLSTTIRDTPNVEARFASYQLCEGTLRAATQGTGTVSYDSSYAPDVSPSGTDGPKWLSGVGVRFFATPAPGYVFKFFNVNNGGSVSTVSEQSFVLTVNGNFTVEAVFSKMICPVSFSVDAASVVSGQSVSATVEGVPDPDFTSLVYGDRVTFSATQDESYHFDGWYEDGVKVSSDAIYTVELENSLSLVAKWSALLTLSSSSTGSASGAVSIDGGTAGQSVSAWIVLGGQASIDAVVLSGAWNSWYDSSDTSFADPLPLSQSDTLTVGDTTSIVSRFVSESDRFYVALFNKLADGTEPEPGIDLGVLSMTLGEMITEADYNAGIVGKGYSGEPIVGAYAYYAFYGTKNSLLSASGSSLAFVRWGMRFLRDGAMTDETVYPESQESNVYTNRHYVFTAYWGELKPVRVGVSFYDDASRGFGKLAMSGATAERVETDESITDMAQQGTNITVRASSFSGYGFAGWFSSKGGIEPVSTSPVYTFDVVADVMLYAKFVPDVNAVYRWEGAATNKTLRWKSKTYVANKPFDPSCARVDSTGYSVALSVEMFSSPNVGASPTATKRIEIVSQDARRLPHGRPEKFCAISVEADGEVDMVAIGTSMEGIAV